MTSADILPFIRARDAAGLRVYMTNERLQVDNIERNNRFLFEACRDGADEIGEVLISFGADVNSVVDDQRTPLYISCLNAHPKCVDLLLASGVNVNMSDLDDGRTPLMAAAAEDGSQFRLQKTIHYRRPSQFIDDCCRCMRSLLSAGAMIEQTDSDGWTALMHATWNFKLTEILIDVYLKVNILGFIQSSALHIASGGNNADVVELLIERGANIDSKDIFGNGSALHYACYRLYPVVVDLLLRRGADINIMDNGGDTALHYAAEHNEPSPIRVAVLQLMATCAQTRFESSSAEWIRLAQHECNRPQMDMGCLAQKDIVDVDTI